MLVTEKTGASVNSPRLVNGIVGGLQPWIQRLFLQMLETENLYNVLYYRHAGIYIRGYKLYLVVIDLLQSSDYFTTIKISCVKIML